MGFERIVPGTLEWEKYFGNHIARYQFASERLRSAQPRLILDAACGVGYGAHHLAATLNANVVGVDRSKEALSQAAANFTRTGVQFLEDDCHTLVEASKQGPIDAVVSMETFEHLPKPMDFLASVRRCLKPGGLFLVSTPNVLEFSNAGEWEFHEKEYSPTEFRGMLTEAGFTEITLLGQRLTERGKDREEFRGALSSLQLNPFMRLGRFLQRTLRGRRIDQALLPERPDDFEFVEVSGTDEKAEGSLVLLATCVNPPHPKEST